MLRRAFAFAIDALLFIIGLSLFSAMTDFADVDAGSDAARSGEYLFDLGVDIRFNSFSDMMLMAFAFLIYKSAPEAIAGKTIGKRLFGLGVIADPSATAIGWKQAILRNLTLIPSWFLLFLPTLLTIVVSNDRKRLGDSLAGTLVVRLDKTPQSLNCSPRNQDAERPVASYASNSQPAAWYRTGRSQAVLGIAVALVLVWAGLRTDFISFGQEGAQSDPLQPGEVFRKNFDEMFPEQGESPGSIYWDAGTAVIQSNMPGLMTAQHFNVGDSGEQLNLSIIAKRFEGEHGIASLLWGFEEDTERYVAVYVWWSGGEIACGVVSSQNSESAVVHEKLPANDCGDPSGGWHHLEIESKGPNLEFLVNGVKIWGNTMGDTPQSIGFAAELPVQAGVTFVAQFDDLVLAELEAK